jgi:DNA polymerase-1
MIASYLLDSSRLQHNLDALARDHLGHRTITYEEVAGKGKKQIPFAEVPLDRASTYACEDADVALRLIHKLEPRLAEDKLEDLYREIEIPLLVVLARMEMNGVLIDTDLLASLSRKFEAELDAIEGRAHDLAGERFNLNSPKQLAGVLYEKLKLPILKRTRKGASSTDFDVLERLAADHDLPREIVRHRQLAKLKGTYVDTLPSLIHPETGRIHTSYNQTVAATGRLSSSDPNLQNIPVRSPEGREIRRAFIPARGRRLLSADYSQIELCILAHLSRDPTLVAAFSGQEDIHRRTASEVFGVSPDEVTAAQRSGAKAVNFGLMYGQGAFGLAQQLGISTREAEAYIEGYFRRFAAVRTYFDRTLTGARKKGYVTTLMKRRRYLRDIESKNRAVRSAAERMAMNTTIQGTAADLIKAAMLAVQARLDKECPDTLMIMQVHDELVFEVPEADLPKVKALVQEEMERIVSLRVPLRVEVRDGANWDEAH